MSELHKSAAWRVISVTAVKNEHKIGHELHVDLEFAVVVQRQSSQRAAYIDSTMLVALLAVLLSYYVPVQQLHTRVLLHVFALSILVICYLVVYTSLPSNGGPVPLVVKSYSGAMTLSLLSLLCVVWLHHLASTPSSVSVCQVFSRLFKSRKVVGTYNTLVEEQPDVAQAPPPVQLPSTATTTTPTTTNHTLVNLPQANETSFSINTTSEQAQTANESNTENTMAAKRAKRNEEEGSNRCLCVDASLFRREATLHGPISLKNRLDQIVFCDSPMFSVYPVFFPAHCVPTSFEVIEEDSELCCSSLHR
ncbi:Neurotransmitter-gated ion-channel transmembrane domain [Trinorchestia longiramus]|nr:Neurotransmitter-gated ion-channel transmembrane domain [Trinorchestia longiramus]